MRSSASVPVLFVPARLILVPTVILSISCGGDGGGEQNSNSQNGQLAKAGLEAANFGCTGDCPNQNLSTDDVTRVLQQGVASAQALGVSATIAVLDRVSNVLGVYQMPGALTTSTVTTETGAVGGLEGAIVPAVFCAISKAGTASNFSSQGNAFGSRTANQLLQENFLPSENNAPSGPLFGVQFSQGLCSDVNLINPDFTAGLPLGRKPTARGLVGPRPQPLGFAAQSGGLPLYKQGDIVGSVGVEFDGIYSLDRDLSDFDDDPEERIALSASIGFEAPAERAADLIFIRGKSLRLSDLTYDDLDPLPSPLPGLEAAGFIPVTGFTNGSIRAGVVFGTPASGYVRTIRAGVEVEVLVNESGAVRFPSRSGTPLPGGIELQVAEVEAMLDATMLLATKTRAQVRQPLDSSARVAVWIVDTAGEVVGFSRSKDTILDSTDVTLQKARTPVFFSSRDAADRLIAAGEGNFVARARELLGPDAFTGNFAFSITALGNISRPYFPDGIIGNPPGPLSLPAPGTAPGPTYSIFNTGLQLDLFIAAFTAPLASPPSIPDSCTDAGVFGNRLRNGVQFFPGGFPIYRNGVLIGGIASSGDGTEQDDFIPFYGVSRKGLDEAGHTTIGDPVLGFNAPKEIRADQIPLTFNNTRLRYVVCPEGALIDGDNQTICDDL